MVLDILVQGLQKISQRGVVFLDGAVKDQVKKMLL